MKEDDLIHITKIPRKPKSVGIELKAVVDGASGILLNLEIQKGANKTCDKYETAPHYYKYHAAIILRLCEPYFSSKRIVVADAAFGGVQSAVALLDHGLHLLGVVKTCSKGYPVKAFTHLKENDISNKRGQHHAFTAKVSTANGEKQKLMAVVWCPKDDRQMKFIATCSNTMPGVSMNVVRYKMIEVGDLRMRQTVYKEIPRPVVLNELYDDFGKVDLHDRYRQGYLAMERAWKTKKCWIRIFTSLLGMIVTDCYLGYLMEYKALNHGEAKGSDSYIDFLGKLAYSMIHYDEHYLRNRAVGPIIEQQEVFIIQLL